MHVLPKRDCGDYSVGAHLFPFRTEKLSPTAPMVLPYRWESRSSPNTIEKPLRIPKGFLSFKPCCRAVILWRLYIAVILWRLYIAVILWRLYIAVILWRLYFRLNPVVETHGRASLHSVVTAIIQHIPANRYPAENQTPRILTRFGDEFSILVALFIMY